MQNAETPDRRGSLSAIYASFRNGDLTRREFLSRAFAAGMALPIALHAAQAVGAQNPEAGPPAVGLEGMARGQGGELRILQWQAPTILAQQANDWSGQNLQRYVNPRYDALYVEVEAEIDPEASAQLSIAMNDLLIADQAVIPLVQRAAEKLAVGGRLRPDNIESGSFETVYWNIANWSTTDG